MNQPSLADNAVSVLAEVKAIGADIPLLHPMRYCVNELRRNAEQILTDAMRQASQIAYAAGRIVRDYDENSKGEAK